MIDQVRSSLLPKPLAEFGKFSNQCEVDDPVTGMLFHRFLDLLKLLVVVPHVNDIKVQVRSIDAFVEELHVARLKSQLPHNVGLHFGGGRRSQCNGRWVADHRSNLGETRVVWSKVVPPLADAVRLVDGQYFDVAARDHVPEFRLAKPLGRNVQHVELAIAYLAITRFAFLAIERRVDVGRRDSASRERVDLIFHQGDQR